MDSAAEGCTTASVTDAQPLRTSSTPRLPPELMLQVLKHVPEWYLPVFARASHACYAQALEAGLCSRRAVWWTNREDSRFRNCLDKLDVVLDRAENRPGLNIAITTITIPRGDDAAAAYQEDMPRLVASIRRALPNLVRLEVPFADYAPLCADEAPKLQALTIYHSGLDVPVFIPPNLFNGLAPRLRKLSLRLNDTDSMRAWQPIAGFDSVTHLRLVAKRITHPLALVRLFKGLRVLAIEALYVPSTRVIDLRGLALRHFALAGNTSLLDDASLALLSNIALFEHKPESAADPVWPAQCGELCAVIERCLSHKPAISFVPRNGAAWQRSVVSQFCGAALPLTDMPVLASNLVSLTVEESLVTAFVQSHIVLERLRELVVDITVPCELGFPMRQLYDAVPRVRCPALERVVLLVVPVADAVPVRVLPGIVRHPWYTLGLRKARPTLTLAGCTWNDRNAWRGRTHPAPPPSDEHVPEYYKTCRACDYFDVSRWN